MRCGRRAADRANRTAGKATQQGAPATACQPADRGTSPRAEKAAANRKNRRHLHQQLQAHGEDADLEPKLWTDWDVI